MEKKIDVFVTVLCLLMIALLPVLRSGSLPQILAWIAQFEITGLGLRDLFGFLILGVQAVPAFWLACFAKHYLTNFLIFFVLAFSVICTRKRLQRKTGEAN